jgi:hypothetical protein
MNMKILIDTNIVKRTQNDSNQNPKNSSLNLLSTYKISDNLEHIKRQKLADNL